MTSWLELWNKPNNAYVNDRHTARHYKALIRDVVNAAGAGQGRTLLDYGCGEAGGTPALLGHGYKVLLHEQSTHYRQAALNRYGGMSGVKVLDDDELRALDADSIDVLLVCSVLQYVPKQDVPGLIEQWRAVLRPGGMLILADITTGRSGPVRDALSLLWSGARHGYFFSGFASLVALLFSDYRKTRQSLRLSIFTPEEIRTLLTPGFEVTKANANFGLNTYRVTFLGRKNSIAPGQGEG